MRFLSVFITLVCLLPLSLYAQKKVFISGKIKDTKEAPVSQALITVEGTTTGVYSDDNGYYSLEVLSGKHTISVSAFGFKSRKRLIDIRNNKNQDFILEEQTVNLSAVEVYGKTKSQQLREGSFTVNAIDVKTYANSLNNLNDLIGRSNGIKIREDGGVGADFDLSINGLSGNSVRYFLDGMPLSSIGNGITLANIPINIVDRIEVYKGVVPAELGADALGGAINIITKKEVKNYLDVSYGIGSFSTHKADLNAQYVDSKTGVFFRPTFGVNYSKNNYTMKNVQVPDADREGFETINAKRFHDGYFSLLGQFNIGVTNKKWADLLSFTTSYSYVNTELQTGSVQNKVYGMAERENKAFNISALYQKREFFTKGLSADLSISQTWDHSIVTDSAFRQYNWRGEYIGASRNEITGRARSIRHTKRPLTIGRANFDYLLNQTHIFNINYMLERVENKRSDDLDSDFAPSKDIFTKHIIGLSYKQSFWNDRWSNTFFVKDYISHLKIGQQDLSWITNSNAVPRSSTSDNWGYGLSSRFHIAEWLSVKGSAERSIRLPLAREYMGNGTTVYPNFALSPENSRNYNFGLFGTINLAQKHNLTYETGLFYRGVKDYIRLVITESEGTSQYQNVNDVTVRGIEGELRYDYDDFLQIIANISYLDEKSKTKYQADGKPTTTYNNRVPNKPWLYSNVELNLRKKNLLGRKENQLKVAYFFQYVHWFYLTWKDYGVFNPEYVIPTQYIHNASITYSLKNEKYNLSLECNNIFDRMTYDNYRMQKPGRSFFCKFRIFIN